MCSCFPTIIHSPQVNEIYIKLKVSELYKFSQQPPPPKKKGKEYYYVILSALTFYSLATTHFLLLSAVMLPIAEEKSADVMRSLPYETLMRITQEIGKIYGRDGYKVSPQLTNRIHPCEYTRPNLYFYHPSIVVYVICERRFISTFCLHRLDI